METSMAATSLSPAQAWPRTSKLSSAFTRAPVCGAVMSDFTGIEVMICMSASGTSVPGATGYFGTR